MNTKRPFTGTGWSFPPTFDKTEKKVLLTSDREDIERSLEILLGTTRGERVMLPNYGCNLDEMIFESFNLTLRNYLMDLVKTAILYHEPRIEPLKISLDDSHINEGRILIKIEYIIRATNSRYNMVYPFYLNEGSEIQNKNPQ
jgi:phage baseplate assembly protein W